MTAAAHDQTEFTLGQLTTEYRRRLTLHRLGQGERPRWMDEIMRPLARELGRAAGLGASVGGPMGVGALVLITLRDLDAEAQESLTFTPHHDGDHFELRLVNTHSDTGRFPPGTLRSRAGLGYETVTLQPHHTAQEILDLHRSFTPVHATAPVHDQ